MHTYHYYIYFLLDNYKQLNVKYNFKTYFLNISSFCLKCDDIYIYTHVFYFNFMITKYYSWN